jgi:hypothetical protein
LEGIVGEDGFGGCGGADGRVVGVWVDVVEFHDGGCLSGDGEGELVVLEVKSEGLDSEDYLLFLDALKRSTFHLRSL